MDQTDRVLQVGTAVFASFAVTSDNQMVAGVFTFFAVLTFCEFMAHDTDKDDDGEDKEEEDQEEVEEE